MKNMLQGNINLEKWLMPETDLEKTLLKDPDFVKGLYWGKPRFGHPEGKVVFHISEVLDNIELLQTDEQSRKDLRIIAFLHDTFKYLEDRTGIPRDWTKHHAVYARKFSEKYISESHILDIIELHDEAYYCFRLDKLYAKPEDSQKRLTALLDRLGEHLQLYYLFFKCDTQTGDKNQASVKWFEQSVCNIHIVEF